MTNQLPGFGDESSAAGSKEVYVTELASPQDRWVSVTDAARIGRRQEHSIRTWIQTGQLPVNPNRVGVNKRTRLVRLSDLAKLTPILDAEAAIGTDIGMLDLPSIPRAFKALEADVLEFKASSLHSLEETNGQIQAISAQLGDQGKRIEEQRTLHQDLLKTVSEWKTGLEKQIEVLSTHTTKALSQLETRLDEKWMQAMTAGFKAVNENLTHQALQQDAALQQAMTTLREIITAGLQQQSEAQAAARQQAIDALRLEMTISLENAILAQEQALSTAQERLTQLQQETAEGLRQSISDQARLTSEQFSSRDQAIAAAHTEASLAHQATISQQQSIERLQQQLEQERKARELLAKDLQTAQQDRQRLADDLTKEQRERAALAKQVGELAKLVENLGKKK
jgi:chromosome segregation ATPase